MINTDREALHFPAVAEAGEGWGVYCAACSDAAQEYVYPCERGRTMPPARLVDPVPLLAENERLRQGLWDIYAALGYDTDGDPTPRAVQGDLAAMVLDAAREHRRDSDEGYAGVCAERDALKAALGRVWALCDEAQKRPRIDVLIHPRDLRAAIDAPEGASPSCTCGYGGVHEELNPRCERNIAALDTPEGENE